MPNIGLVVPPTCLQPFAQVVCLYSLQGGFLEASRNRSIREQNDSKCSMASAAKAVAADAARPVSDHLFVVPHTVERMAHIRYNQRACLMSWTGSLAIGCCSYGGPNR